MQTEDKHGVKCLGNGCYKYDGRRGLAGYFKGHIQKKIDKDFYS